MEEKYTYPRPHLPVDEIKDGQGTVFDTARIKPSHKFRIYKRTKRKLQDLEEMKKLVQNKGLSCITREELEEIINS